MWRKAGILEAVGSLNEKPVPKGGLPPCKVLARKTLEVPTMMTAVAFACVSGLTAKTIAEDSKLWPGYFGEPCSTAVTSSPTRRESFLPQAGRGTLACLLADFTSCQVDNDYGPSHLFPKAWQ